MRVRFNFKWIASVAAVVMAGASSRADDVTLKNGDLLTGTITRVTPLMVDLTTNAAGEIHLKRDAVRSLLSIAAVPIVAADGAEHRAFLVPAEDWGGWHEAPQAIATAPSRISARMPLTASIDLPQQSGPVVLGYLGSSTWALNQGSGQVPALIEALLKSRHPGAAITTVNGAVGSTRVRDYMPGKPASDKLKSQMQAQPGFKVLRLMIGSNDAAAALPVAQWQADMKTLIEDALSWPVDLIVLEEIGVRTDKRDAGIALIREYNAARSKLAGPKVLLGTACTLQNQSDHLDTLSKDNIHQMDAGQQLLADTQAAEMESLFKRPAQAATQR